MVYYSKSSPYASTTKQWSYFRALTGHSLPSGCSKSEASRLIDKAKRGEWAPALRNIEICQTKMTTGAFDHCMKAEFLAPYWEVSIDYRSAGPHFETQEAAMAWATAQLRTGETVAVSTSIRSHLVD